MAYPYTSNYPYQPMATAPQPPMQATMPQQMQTPVPTVRTVYSEAEARGAQIPIDGSICIFADASNGKLYTKRFDYSTGAFPFEVYVKAVPVETATPEYITRAQFDEWRAGIEELIATKTKPTKGGKADAE